MHALCIEHRAFVSIIEVFFIVITMFFHYVEGNAIKSCWKMRLKRTRRKVKPVPVVEETRKRNANPCMVSTQQ